MTTTFKVAQRRAIAAASLVILAGATGNGFAAVTISNAPTENMICNSGVCTPTSDKAVLNAGDLEALLASGSVTVTTAGTGVQAGDIELSAPLTWATSNTLSLNAYRAITVDKPLEITGLGGLSLATNDGGSDGRLSFGPKGHVEFAGLSNALTINGVSYMLVGNIASLASAIAANPAGAYALAADYDASADGTYASTPIATEMTGTLEGLGNSITKLSLSVTGQAPSQISLIGTLGTSGKISNLRLAHEKVTIERGKKAIKDGAGLVLNNYGTMSGDQVSGSLTGECICSFGGLVWNNFGPIDHSWANVHISTLGQAGGLVAGNASQISTSHASGSVIAGIGGGLVGGNEGTIDQSYADAAVTGGDNSFAGGLVGIDEPLLISNSYATGKVTGGNNSYVGGLDGKTFGDGSIENSYSVGTVTAGASSVVGGFLGYYDTTRLSECYWSTDTSGTDQGTGFGNVSGLTGLSSEQLQAGLPDGFQKKIWREKASLNSGFPYLVAIPPKK